MSDITDCDELQALVASSLPLITRAVRYAFRRYSYLAQTDEIDEVAGQIVLFLLDRNCRMARRYASERAKVATWLYYVALNHVGPYLKRQGVFVSLEAFTVDHFRTHPKQEELVLQREQHQVIRKAFGMLTDRERSLIRLTMRGLGDKTIAGMMSIETQTVRQERYLIRKKLRLIFAETCRASVDKE